MQTPKARSGSSEVPQRKSKSPATPRTARQLKIPGADLDSNLSASPATKPLKDKSPKLVDRRSPRSPAIEKKRQSQVSELESQIAQLQEELKKAKDQLNSSESWKRRAIEEAEDTKKKLEAMSAKLEDSQQQLIELSASEDDRIQELRKISHDRDKAWQSELEAVQKQHSMDSAALASAINEIQKLKSQLENAKHAESAHSLSLIEKLKTEVNECRESEAQAFELVRKIENQLETANATAEMIRLDGIKAAEAYNCLAMELEESRDRLKSLEELVTINAGENSRDEGENQVEKELNSAKFEVGQLRSALEASERRYQEEYIQSTLQIRSAYEQVEKLKSESAKKEAELETELNKAKTNIEELMAKEGVNSEMEKNIQESELAMELKKLKNDLAELKASLSEKESQLRSISEENEKLKMEIGRTKAEIAKGGEQEALVKLGNLTEELDKSQGANSEMEAELRRLKVQSEQWRKAAEAAAAMLTTGNNGKFDNSYSNTIGATLELPYSEDMDDESPKKKNMLKKIGVLWKKGQK